MADVIFNRPLQNEDLEATLDAYEKDVNPETEHDFIAMLGDAGRCAIACASSS
ncbi:hypothetical protein [Weissella cibaria]|uniref:hypothetical protein n=1 Tax=Weissella cibaria TaxID=137591 RepID=UPI001FD6BB74|nr:hypothetical protein [Weissella cibaria]